jgi:nucleoside-diphosphate-sugar epimerase
MPDPRHALITGAAGFLGSHLRKALEQIPDCRVTAVDCHAGQDGDVVIDLASSEAVDEALARGILPARADIIIHLAARLAEPGGYKDVSMLYDNLRMVESVTRIAMALGCRRILHASTMGVYPNRTGSYPEDAATNSVDSAEGLYGLSKITGEQLMDLLLKGSGIKTVHLRFGQIYGPGMRSDRVMKIMERELVESGHITLFGAGERESNFIAVEHAVAALIRFLDSGSGVFNIGQRQATYRDIAMEIARRHDCDAEVLVPVEHGCREKVILDCAKYEQFVRALESA